MNDPNRNVTMTFSCAEKHAVDFKIRIKYDSLTQSSFFQEILRLYLISDPDFLLTLEKIKTNKAKMGKSKVTKSIKEINKGRELMKSLSLTESEKSSLFDLIENEEHEDK